jgi:hypothetical protein
VRASPYREDARQTLARMKELESENGRLRSTTAALFVLTLILAGLAAWWCGLLWRLS